MRKALIILMASFVLVSCVKRTDYVGLIPNSDKTNTSNYSGSENQTSKSSNSYQSRSQPAQTNPISTTSTASTRAYQYVIQAGAFSNVSNSVNLVNQLKKSGIDAYHFKDKDNLYKVRFEEYSTIAKAESRAKNLVSTGVIEDYYIVAPTATSAANYQSRSNLTDIRSVIVSTSNNYLGVPYLWGGTDPSQGFDCSGLTYVVFGQNGIRIPRVSKDQFKAGKSIQKSQLKPGDLVFFATGEPGIVSHVGIFAGNGQFIHAPSKGSTVRYEKMSNSYFASRYMGARTYF